MASSLSNCFSCFKSTDYPPDYISNGSQRAKIYEARASDITNRARSTSTSIKSRRKNNSLDPPTSKISKDLFLISNDFKRRSSLQTAEKITKVFKYTSRRSTASKKRVDFQPVSSKNYFLSDNTSSHSNQHSPPFNHPNLDHFGQFHSKNSRNTTSSILTTISVDIPYSKTIKSNINSASRQTFDTPSYAQNRKYKKALNKNTDFYSLDIPFNTNSNFFSINDFDGSIFNNDDASILDLPPSTNHLNNSSRVSDRAIRNLNQNYSKTRNLFKTNQSKKSKAVDQSQFFQSNNPKSVITSEVLQTNNPKSIPQSELFQSNTPISVITSEFFKSNTPKSIPQSEFFKSNNPKSVIQSEALQINNPKSVIQSEALQINNPKSIPQSNQLNIDLQKIDSKKITTLKQNHSNNNNTTTDISTCNRDSLKMMDFSDIIKNYSPDRSNGKIAPQAALAPEIQKNNIPLTKVDLVSPNDINANDYNDSYYYNVDNKKIYINTKHKTVLGASADSEVVSSSATPSLKSKKSNYYDALNLSLPDFAAIQYMESKNLDFFRNSQYLPQTVPNLKGEQSHLGPTNVLPNPSNHTNVDSNSVNKPEIDLKHFSKHEQNIAESKIGQIKDYKVVDNNRRSTLLGHYTTDISAINKSETGETTISAGRSGYFTQIDSSFVLDFVLDHDFSSLNLSERTISKVIN
ncbi:hypothetical protein BB561_002178 [Smittium simulii]|uniref:Uncharacterized protein n=1 Tax=Smittium simulii TaxID=133385 RepID=A0A2T9YRQ4_9FUNG|nr:hypothetical protein BB561_002178 [Smittium simulii]